MLLCNSLEVRKQFLTISQTLKWEPHQKYVCKQYSIFPISIILHTRRKCNTVENARTVLQENNFETIRPEVIFRDRLYSLRVNLARSYLKQFFIFNFVPTWEEVNFYISFSIQNECAAIIKDDVRRGLGMMPQQAEQAFFQKEQK